MERLIHPMLALGFFLSSDDGGCCSWIDTLLFLVAEDMEQKQQQLLLAQTLSLFSIDPFFFPLGYLYDSFWTCFFFLTTVDHLHGRVHPEKGKR